MARKISGKVTTSQFRRTQKNGDVYVYERTLQYNPEKGYTEQIASRLLGKIPAGGSEMKPTRSRSSFGSKAATATRKTIGAMDILEWVGRESGPPGFYRQGDGTKDHVGCQILDCKSGRNDPAHRGMAD